MTDKNKGNKDMDAILSKISLQAPGTVSDRGEEWKLVPTPSGSHAEKYAWDLYQTAWPRQSNLNIPAPRATPRALIWIFWFLAVKFPSLSSKKLFKCPTSKTRWTGKKPHHWIFFLSFNWERSFQNNML